MKNIILINGKKRSGKDTTADFFVKKGYTKSAFGTKLKEFSAKILNISLDELEKYKNNEQKINIDFKDLEERFFIELNKLQKEENYSIDRLNNYDLKTAPFFYDNFTKIDVRAFLQNINIVKFLFNDDNVWCKKIDLSSDNIVISDLRFKHEFEYIKSLYHNITTIKVIGKNYYNNDKNSQHQSEIDLDDFEFDYHINNTIWQSGSLFWQAQGLLHELQIKENNEK